MSKNGEQMRTRMIVEESKQQIPASKNLAKRVFCQSCGSHEAKLHVCKKCFDLTRKKAK